jgi:hypothetical protein
MEVRGSDFRNDGSLSIDGNGRLRVTATQTNKNRVSAANGGLLQLVGATTNEGIITANSGAGVEVHVVENFVNGVFRGGTWRVGAGSKIQLHGAAITDLNANLVLEGPNSELTTGQNTTFALAGLASIGEGGRLSLLGGRDVTTAGALLNAGSLSLGAGSVLMVNGTYMQTATGALGTSIADGGNSARLAATNTASLNGNLTVSSAPGFIPSSGSTFEMLSASAINGQFTQPQFTGFDPGLQLDVVYDTTNVSVQAVRAFPLGDADQDGDIDQADYGVWRSTFGSNNRRADFNGNGIIDAVDYVLWRNALVGAASSTALTGTDTDADASTTHNIHGANDADADDPSPKLGGNTQRRPDPAFLPAIFDQALANWPAMSSNGRVPRFKQLALAAANGRPLDETDLFLNIAISRLDPTASIFQPLDDGDHHSRGERQRDSIESADDFFAEVGVHPNDPNAEIAALHE